jgi:predicted outer membrane repeat protein
MTTLFRPPNRLCLALLLIGSAIPAWAGTLTVTSTADLGPGTLRKAVDDAMPGDTIAFALDYPATIFPITNITINKNLTIQGPGADKLTLDGGAFAFATLSIASGATVDISRLTLRNSALSGIVNSGTLTVNRVVFSDNYSNAYGGAIGNSGSLTVNDSTFSHNRAGNRGGAIYNNAGATFNRCSFTNNAATRDGGAIASFGNLEVNKSTFSGNTASGNFGGSGGAIYNESTLTVKDSTLSGNSSSGAGGAIFTRGPITLSGSTMSGNGVPAGGSGNAIFNYSNVSISRSIIVGTCGGTLPVSAGDNIGSTDSCLYTDTDLNDRANANARLDALADNGGPTQTMLPQGNSPAIDAVRINTADCTGTDQRGVRRPSGVRCDIGAVELDFDTIFVDGFE